MSVPLNNTSHSLVPFTPNSNSSTNLGSAQKQTKLIAQNVIVSPFPTQSFSSQPNTILSNYVLAYLKLPELARIAATDKRVNNLCLNLMISWINAGNPIIIMNKDVEKLIPFFARKEVNEGIKWLNLTELKNYHVLVQGCSNFEHLTLKETSLEESEIQCLLAKKNRLKSIEIDSTLTKTDYGILLLGLFLGSHVGLRSLRLCSITPDQQQMIVNIKPETILGLIGSLNQITDLDELDLRANKIGVNTKNLDALAARLKTNRTLRILSLEEIGLCDEGGMDILAEPLGTLENLQKLVLSKNHLTLAGVGALVNQIANLALQELYLDFNPIGGDNEDGHDWEAISLKSANILMRLQTLSVLSLGFCKIKDQGIEMIAKSLQLGLANLTSLNVSGNEFGIKGLTTLLEELKKRRLKELDLADLKIGDEGLTAIGDYLENTPLCLTKLNITRLYPDEVQAGDAAIQNLLIGVVKQTSLKTLQCLNTIRVDTLNRNGILVRLDHLSENQINLIKKAIKINNTEFIYCTSQLER